MLDLQWVRRALLLALFDIAIIIASSLLALFARFDFSYAQIEVPYLSNLYHYLPISIIVNLLIFYFCRMYHSLWKFVGVHEFGYMLLANGISFFRTDYRHVFDAVFHAEKLFLLSDYFADSDGLWGKIFLPIYTPSERGEGTEIFQEE